MVRRLLSRLYVSVSRPSLTAELYSLSTQSLCVEVTSTPHSTNTNHSNYVFSPGGVKASQADIYGTAVKTEFNVQQSVVTISSSDESALLSLCRLATTLLFCFAFRGIFFHINSKEKAALKICTQMHLQKT